LLSILSISAANALPRVGFEHISLGQGLSQSSVFAITQDHLGFLWFGTQDGLDRYDGYSFKVFRNNPEDSTSLSYNYISRLMVDKEGSVWVGTIGGGVSVYDQITGRFTQYVHKPGDPASLSNNDIHALYQDRSGTIWVGTQDGLNRFEPATRTFRRYYFRGAGSDTLRDDLISYVFEDRENRLWVGSINGASILNERTGTLTRIDPRGIVVNKILQTKRGNLLFDGTGVWAFDSLRHRLIPWKRNLTDRIEPNIGSECAILNADGTIWIGSYDGLGLVGVDKDTVAVFRHNPDDPASLSENSVLSLYKDRSGILWVGTYDGINKYVPTKKKFAFYTLNPKDANSLSNVRVRSFTEDAKGRIWIATQGGLDRFNPASGRFTRYIGGTGVLRDLTANTFWCVLADRTSRDISIWAGSNGGGIDILTFHKGHYSQPVARNIRLSVPQYKSVFTDVVNSLYQDRAGNIWAGNSNGVTLIRRTSNGFLQKSFPYPASVNAVFQGRDGAIWIGGYSFPLHKLDGRGEKFVSVFGDSTFENTLAGKSVLSITGGSGGMLWVGTYGGLLEITEAGRLVRHVTVKDGLPNNVIYGILKDSQGNLWLSTDMGICKYSPSTGNVRDYTHDDGLQSNEFNQGAAFEASDGKFYFGGINGFNSFYPDSIRDNPNVPPVVFTDLKIFNTSVKPGQNGELKQTIWTARSLRLDYSDAVLTFDFAALEYTDPRRNSYAYKLVGFDKDWVFLGDKREVTYTNLDPGSYVLRVRASNNDGVWNKNGASLEIYISPPLWMTWWFRTIAVLLFLSIGPLIYYRRVTSLKKESALRREFSRRLIESQETERSRIAAELHDTIGQDLLVIKNRAYLAQQAKRLNQNAKAQLENITETATQSLQNVRAIVRNLRPYHLGRIGLTAALKAMLDNVIQSSPIRFEISVDQIDGFLADGTKEREVNFFRIVQESVNNIIKHSAAENASVTVKREAGRIVAIIHDDGKGFDFPSAQENGLKVGLGLSSMSERAGMLGGSLTVSSGTEIGTTVTLTVDLVEGNRAENKNEIK
jgi:signal transduction histidine kinase/ligand-binding sensor domain-containing protein